MGRIQNGREGITLNTCRINYTQRNRVQPGTQASFLIHFSGWDGSAVYGKLWSAYSESPVSFVGLESLLQELENEMDAIDCPSRTFSECGVQLEMTRRRERETPRKQPYPCAVSVKVYRRQNGEMQGEFQICKTDWRAWYHNREDLMTLMKAALGNESA